MDQDTWTRVDGYVAGLLIPADKDQKHAKVAKANFARAGNKPFWRSRHPNRSVGDASSVNR